MQEYYNKRAKEYEEIYHRDDPARQAELDALESAMFEALAGRDVLEIACGTGYWTEQLARVAGHVVATDASEEMLAIAGAKPLPATVKLLQADAYDLEKVTAHFDGCLANFWFSHVPKERVSEFLLGLHSKLMPGARVFMADNVYQPGVGGELVTVDGQRDTFKRRMLRDGSEYLVLKNYYSADELSDLFAPLTTDLRVHEGENYWWITYCVGR